MDKQYTIIGGELYHYGVPGMKWGRRKMLKYEKKARTARDSANEWDEMATYAEQRGKTKRAAKYRQYAADERREADALTNLSKGKTSGYKDTRKFGTKVVDTALTGVFGSYKISKLQEKGVTEKNARARVIVQNLLIAGAGAAVSLGAYAYQKKRLGF